MDEKTGSVKTEFPEYYVVKELDGLRCPTDFEVKNFIETTTYEPTEDDVIIATYPKNGTTWTQSILWMLTHNLQKCPDPNILIFGRFMEFQGKEFCENLEDRPKVMKTHYSRTYVPWSNKAKYIVVVRNPYDCVVSLFHHTKNFVDYRYIDGTFPHFFEIFMRGEVDWGDYFEHLASWYRHKDDENVLFLTFEEMKADLSPVIKKIADFVGGECRRLVDDERNLQAIVDGVDIKKMKKANVDGYGGKFFRKGIVGDWSSYLTDEMKTRMVGKLRQYDELNGIAEIWKGIDGIPV